MLEAGGSRLKAESERKREILLISNLASNLVPLTSNLFSLSLNLPLTLAGFFSILLNKS